MALLPPVPPGTPLGSGAWADYYEKIRRAINDGQKISYSQITDFTGSNLTDLQTRQHNSLQAIQGGTTNEYYHLTAAQYSALTGGGLGPGLGPVATKTGAYTLVAADYTILANTSAGSFTITLPASPAQGTIVNIKKISLSNTLTIGRNGKNIEGAAADLTITGSLANTMLQYDSTFGWAVL